MAQLHTSEMLNVSEEGSLPCRMNDARNSCVHDLFVSAAITNSGQVALTGDEGSLSYAEPLRRAKGIALRLRHEGLGSGSLLGLAAGRSFSTTERNRYTSKLRLR